MKLEVGREYLDRSGKHWIVTALDPMGPCPFKARCLELPVTNASRIQWFSPQGTWIAPRRIVNGQPELSGWRNRQTEIDLVALAPRHV